MTIVNRSHSGCCCRTEPFFFFNDTATTEIYTLSLHDALPISLADRAGHRARRGDGRVSRLAPRPLDRKSTRLNSSHTVISYAVFCLKKKKYYSAAPPRHRVLAEASTSNALAPLATNGAIRGKT